MPPAGNDRLQHKVLQRLESLHRAGVTHLPRPTGHRRIGIGSSNSEEKPAAQPEPAAAGRADSDLPLPVPRPDELLAPICLADNALPVIQTLAQLEFEVAGCTRCPELVAQRTQTVFGVGNPQPRLCFLGEAPGADEDRQGEPFVGRAGQLLNKIIEACKLRRDEVYILNILKCRPPGNRNPMPHEAANCRGFLDRQLELLRPEYICCLGAVAAQNLLETTASIGKLRGRLFDHRGIKVACTYHPAYLLRNPAAKRDAWDDMQMLMRAMGLM